MSNSAPMKITRVALILAWIFAAACFFFPLYYADIGGFGRLLFVLLIGVHAAEFPFFVNTYRRAGGSLWSHFRRHMIYGMVYRAEVMRSLRNG